ncbi:zinc finger protein 567-like [Patiria miniata]|uniref:C2H2-type domain-containing protein n=1 Tax=Patiria miniata TaxID=46514 RepID=A0A914API4_PATMI|nr:zinc finger protein 567-like [Patiria miniata]
MQSMEPVPAARAPSYHSITGLSYTELWNSIHANYHPVSSNYSLPEEQQQQLQELSPVVAVNETSTADMELSSGSSTGGFQWSGDSSVTCGSGSPAKERGQSATTSIYSTAGTKDLTGLRPYQPSSAQNRLTVQTLASVDRDQYSFNPARWADHSKPFHIADSDAADTLLSMKRAAVFPLNAAVAKPGGTKGLCTDYGYEELKPSTAQCVKKESSSRQNWDVLRYGRDAQDTRDGLHPWYCGNQELSHFLSSTETNDQPPTTKELASEPDDFRSARHRATTDGHHTAVYTNPKTINSHHWPSSPALNIRDLPANSWYYTRSIGDSLSNSFATARWNVNAPPPLPKHHQQPLVITGGSGAAATPVTNRSPGAAGGTITLHQQTLKYNDNNNKSNNQASQNHQCHICGKSCTRPSSLRTHLRCHYGEKPFLCQLCGKSFSQAANLTAHMRIHSGEKPFKCVVCNRSFSQSSSVKTHMRTHTGERPYPCTFCSKSFSDSSTLSNHRRTHTGEKPYKCRACCRSFSQSGNLNRHLRIHRRTSGGQSASAATGGMTALRE